MSVKDRLEEQEDHNFEEADITAFNGDEEKFKKFHQLKDDALSFLKSVENTLFRIKIQIQHERELHNEKTDESKILIDSATGKKKILNLEESTMHVQKKSHMQEHIDKNRVTLQKGLASLELMQMYEQELNDKIVERRQLNEQKIKAIKTQLFLLRSLQSHITKLINDDRADNPSSAQDKSNRLSMIDKGSEASKMTSGRMLKDKKEANQVTFSPE